MSFSDTIKVDEDFMAPVNDLLRDYVRNKLEREGGLSDQHFIYLGVTRALEGDDRAAPSCSPWLTVATDRT